MKPTSTRFMNFDRVVVTARILASRLNTTVIIVEHVDTKQYRTYTQEIWSKMVKNEAFSDYEMFPRMLVRPDGATERLDMQAPIAMQVVHKSVNNVHKNVSLEHESYVDNSLNT